MHVLTLNIEHLGIGRLGRAGLYTATADLAQMLESQGVQVSEVWWNTPGSDASVVARAIQPLEAYQLLASNQIAAIYTQYVQPGLALEVAAHAWPHAVPVISICHDLSAQMDALQAWVASPARHASDAVTISSRAGAAALYRMLEQAGAGTDWPAVDVAVLPLGTFQPDARLTRATARAARGWDPADVVYLWVGRFSDRHKADLRPLLLAFRSALADTPGARLVALGSDDGLTLSSLQAAAADLGIGDRCDWLPDAADSERDQCLAGADVFVSVADNIQETFGLAIVEAMAYGLPVIAADWSGFHDLVQDGETGIRVSTQIDPAWLEAPNPESFGSLSAAVYAEPEALATALVRLGRSPELRRRMGEAGRRAARRYSWSELGPRYVGLLADRARIAARGPARPTPRPWLASAFGGFATSTLSRTARLVTGYLPAEDALRLISDDRVRAAASRVADRVGRGDGSKVAELVPAGGLTVERAALMLLLKYGALRMLREDGT